MTILGISIIINLLMFIPAYFYRTDKLTDISYAVTFVVCAFFGYLYSSMEFGHTLLLLFILIWSVRLGSFLLYRIRKVQKDSRFDKIRNNFYKFLGFWLLQGLTVFILLVPSLLLWDSTFDLNTMSIIGLTIAVSGLLIESFADIQKYNFRTRSKKWIDEGLWKASRHPNYLGEILVWIGVYLYCIGSFDLTQAIIALVGPLFIIIMLNFVSGIPLLEKASDKKWGKTTAYINYKKSVPVLIPSIKSISRLFK